MPRPLRSRSEYRPDDPRSDDQVRPGLVGGSFRRPGLESPGRTLYQRGAFQFLPGKSTVPLLVDHDDAREVGTVHELFELDWIDGPWIAARATVTDPPVWLRRGETKASFGFKTFDRREFDIRGTRAEVIAGAIVTEVSVLSPGVKPAEPRAEVWSFRPADPAPVAGEVILGGQRIVRHAIGQVLGSGDGCVRVVAEQARLLLVLATGGVIK